MQETIVAVIVTFAAWSVLRRYAPKALRQACRIWTARMARRLGWQTLEQRIEAKAQADASCADGCGSCKACGPVVSTSTSANAPEARSAISLDNLKLTIKR